MYFDEAHSLARAVQKPIEKVHERSQYHNLGTVLAQLVDQRVFFIFLSTNSRIDDFAPTYNAYPSDRVVDGSQLITPFTELPFDIYEEDLLDSVGPLTLKSMCKTDTIIGFGRPLWQAYRKSHPARDIFRLALDKLCASGDPRHKNNSLLAALGVRACQVAPPHNSFNPSSCEGRRQIAGRLLVTSAYEMALKEIPRPPVLEPHFHRPISVLSFLRALFHQDHFGLILEAKSLTRRTGIDNLGTAFADAYVFFSHFALSEDSEMLSAFGLATALVRGMALHTKDGQEKSIDAVIPIHMGSPTTQIS